MGTLQVHTGAIALIEIRLAISAHFSPNWSKFGVATYRIRLESGLLLCHLYTYVCTVVTHTIIAHVPDHIIHNWEGVRKRREG